MLEAGAGEGLVAGAAAVEVQITSIYLEHLSLWLPM